MTTISGHTTRSTGTILSAAIYNADHTNHVTNATALNSGKIEAAAGPVVDGHVVLFDGTAGNAIKTAGYAGLDPADALLKADNLSGIDSAATAFNNIKQDATDSATGVVEEATDAEVRASTNAKFLDAGHLNTAAATVALSSTSNLTALDWSSGINFTLTLSENSQISNPTNEIVGQWRTIEVVGNDATARTLTFGTEFELVPTLTDITSTKSYTISIRCMGAGRFRAYADLGADPT